MTDKPFPLVTAKAIRETDEEFIYISYVKGASESIFKAQQKPVMN